jgi:hypothetical protein
MTTSASNWVAIETSLTSRTYGLNIRESGRAKLDDVAVGCMRLLKIIVLSSNTLTRASHRSNAQR